MAMTIYSLIQEIIHNNEFNRWCKDNGLIISVFTVISSADVEALHVLSSKIAGLQVFSAPPLSNKISKLIFWVGCINILLEDIPQFIIQVRRLLLTFFLKKNWTRIIILFFYFRFTFDKVKLFLQLFLLLH
jgi:hypothetical protein